MAINFPASPTDGQKFTNGAVTYTYNSAMGIWKAASSGTALPFNKIVNPAMLISQQNGDTLSSNNGYFPADMWMFAFSGGASNRSSARYLQTSPKGSPYVVGFDANYGV